MITLFVYRTISFQYVEYMLFIAVAILRGYFVVGLFSSLAISEQKKRAQSKF